MVEKIKTFFIGVIAGIVATFTLLFRRKRKNVSDNRIGTNPVGEEQSRTDIGNQNTESTIDAVEFTVADFGITNTKLEEIGSSNNAILQSIRKRQQKN